MVGGAGERPAKSSLTSPVFVRLDGPTVESHRPPRLRVHNTPKAHGAPPAGSKIPRGRYQCQRRECGSDRIVMHADVPCGNRTMVMRSQTTAALDDCQLFFSGHKLSVGLV
jgi:hypothetical protein